MHIQCVVWTDLETGQSNRVIFVLVLTLALLGRVFFLLFSGFFFPLLVCSLCYGCGLYWAHFMFGDILCVSGCMHAHVDVCVIDGARLCMGIAMGVYFPCNVSSPSYWLKQVEDINSSRVSRPTGSSRWKTLIAIECVVLLAQAGGRH